MNSIATDGTGHSGPDTPPALLVLGAICPGALRTVQPDISRMSGVGG